MSCIYNILAQVTVKTLEIEKVKMLVHEIRIMRKLDIVLWLGSLERVELSIRTYSN